mmetsp:Transcript_81033/g.160582  ORF Transcript_81033/g.160582 Transcript_81033/m.160582 type:complete len:208 (-) Transcript_81033:1131-1754(-)
MWRGAVLESTHEEAKLVLRLLFRKTKNFKDLLLQRTIMYSDGAATDLYAVDDHVIGVCAHVAKTRVLLVEARHCLNVLGPWRCKRVVLGDKTFFILIPLQHWKVNHPEAAKPFVAQAKFCAHKMAELPHRFLGLELWPTKEAKKVTRTATARSLVCPGCPGFALLFSKELLCGAVKGTILEDLHPDKGTCTNLLPGGPLFQLFHFLS